MTPSNVGLPETVHIVPLGHEIDRAVKPLLPHKAERVHLLAIPPQADFDARMKEKQTDYTKKVIDRLEEYNIRVQFHPVNMFDILEVLKTVSRIIIEEKERGNNIFVNMSSCGRKTAFAVTIAAMFHEVDVYYVSADMYATGEFAEKERDHGMSIVESGNIERLQRFPIRKPDPTNIQLLAELYRRKINNKSAMRSDDIITLFHDLGVQGFEKKPDAMRTTEKLKQKRPLLNRINRMLKELVDQEYITKKKDGKEFFVDITDAGSHIACVSGLIKK
ncbi:MAG: hypothetical protein A4E38_01843 [Methanoregulaceae archaeon PtaB.Bin108]|jgi:transcription elongation factor Elf1|nr:MAG: hypothetical protein A4E38_01843 [Methanoregulaceae archaeon PtaB.Bin108]